MHRVALDVGPLAAVRTGVGRYCLNLIRGLLGQPAEMAFLAYSTGRKRPDLHALGIPIESVHIPLPARLTYRLWDWTGHPRMDAWAGGADLCHGTNFVPPATRSARKVTTFHDLAFLRHPGWCSPKIAGLFAKGAAQYIRDSDHLIACSMATRDDLVNLLGADPARITVVYEGVDQYFKPLDPAEAQVRVAPLGIRAPYLLFMGTLEPRKNVETLARVYRRMAAQTGLSLVVAGATGWNTGPAEAALERASAAGSVIRPGYVPDEDLPALYAGAEALVFPSHYEGFGLPVLEAMACGCPVVCSNAGSLPEIAGTAALLHAPEDETALEHHLRHLLEDPALRSRCVAEGIVQARRFTWEHCAEETLQVYREVLA